MRTWLALVVLPALVLGGCAADAGSDPAVTADENAIVAGPLDWSHPAVGTLGACSATLVAADVVLTSRDCHGDAFEVRDARGELAGRYTVSAETAVGDLVVAKLGAPVPGSVAPPIELAAEIPADGARATVLGFGCTGQRVEDARKRSAAVRWTAGARTACPGTVVLDDAGRAIAVQATLVPPSADAIRSAL